jgi:hypothetical protein
LSSFKGLLIIPVLCAPSALGAELPPRPAQEYLELDEVLVQGRRPVNNVQTMTSWLSRLVGEFRYEGHVERHLRDGATVERAEVQGVSTCQNIGAPGLVQCLMNVSWPETRGPDDQDVPGGASCMTPAVALYGIQYEPIPPGQTPDPQFINHMQVDSRGLAETGMGQLFDDTLIYKTRCADLPGNCQRVVQIEAPPDRKFVRMSVDIERDSKLAVRYFFQWNRVPQAQDASDSSGQIVVAHTRGAIMPADEQTWLRKLVGNFRSEDVTQECIFLMALSEEQRLKPCALDKSGRTECLGIGDGPGVRCMSNMGWRESRAPASRHNPAYELWGYDSVARRIVRAWASPALLDNVGGAMSWSGKLGGNRLTFPPPCAYRPSCKTHVFTMAPDGGNVRIGLIHPTGEAIHSTRIRIVNGAAPTTPGAPRKRKPPPGRP